MKSVPTIWLSDGIAAGIAQPRARPADDEVRIGKLLGPITRERFGTGGDFLFGGFCAADAMFAPVVNRLHVYDVPVSAESRAYMDLVMALPAYQDWQKGAAAESWRIAKYEVA